MTFEERQEQFLESKLYWVVVGAIALVGLLALLLTIA